MDRTLVRTGSLAIVLCAGFVTLPPASGAEFSWQLAGSYRQDDVTRVVESSHSSLRATYYLSPVDDEAGPYGLAPFLNRSSSVTIDVARSKLREEPITTIFITDPTGGATLPPDLVGIPGGIGFPGLGDIPTEFGIDTSEYAVSGRYVWPGSGWYVGARSERGDSDSTPEVFFTEIISEQEGYELFAGRYVGSRTTVQLGFGTRTRSETVQTNSSFFSSVPFVPFDPFPFYFETIAGTETDTEDASLSVRHVGETGGLTWSVSASVRSSRSETRISLPVPIFGGFPGGLNPPRALGPNIVVSPQFLTSPISRSDRQNNYSLSGALFPTDALGVRLIYSRLDRDTVGNSDLVGLSATWFFVRNAAAEIVLRQTNFDGGFGSDPPDTDSVQLQLLGRF